MKHAYTYTVSHPTMCESVEVNHDTRKILLIVLFQLLTLISWFFQVTSSLQILTPAGDGLMPLH